MSRLLRVRRLRAGGHVPVMPIKAGQALSGCV